MIMKKTVFLTLVVSILWVGVSTPARGQYVNYASAYIGSKTTDYHSLIRTIDDTSALVYYFDRGANKGVIARMGLTLSCRKAFLPAGYTLNDMRISGNDVYFCGSDGANPIMGHVLLSDFSGSTRTLTFYKANRTYVTSLNRMVAYSDGSGGQKVVMVGDLVFTTHPTFPCTTLMSYYDPELGYNVSFYIHYCRRTIIIEADFNGSMRMTDICVVTGDTAHHEVISEVLETQNYVAFVGHYTNHHTTIVHKCSKNSVVADFTNPSHLHYCYYGILEGHSNFHGCVMNGDTIAVSSLSTYYDGLGVEHFSTNIRGFDLASMVNTFAQRVPLNTKSEPCDLMYMKKNHCLVLLQDINLPSLSSDQNTFVHLAPYNYAPTYYAKCWYESSWQKPFNSLSNVNDTVYVSSGGEYWCMKDVDQLTPNTCYDVDAIEITTIAKEIPAREHDPYNKYPRVLDSLFAYPSSDNEPIIPSCIIP